jgi:hypothetical protein
MGSVNYGWFENSAALPRPVRNWKPATKEEIVERPLTIGAGSSTLSGPLKQISELP